MIYRKPLPWPTAMPPPARARSAPRLFLPSGEAVEKGVEAELESGLVMQQMLRIARSPRPLAAGRSLTPAAELRSLAAMLASRRVSHDNNDYTRDRAGPGH